ncbi:cell division protein FtsK [Streptomyces sp. JV178]|uniref:FHA domain-containing protein n=1 Tax=Streptomyces sp. JV178 TaxID=858632 RepID=UPI000C1B3010|nr:FHA domain-containing protein [Streptomyces sp. JV178]PIM73838.1 cell division protein FtsK [Streptomyces sp. JV178]
MQIRLTVVDPLGPTSEPRGRATACDVLVTAPAGTALAAVASGLASAVGDGGAAQPERGREAGGQVVLYAGAERLDVQRCTLGEPPLIDGAVLSLGAPSEPGPEVDEAAAQLHVVAGPDAGGVHLLHGGKIHIGRSADADVPLDDPDVSRLHCAVTLSSDGRVTVVDLGSTNGTTLDGEHVGDRPVRLAPGALLRIGESALRLASSSGTRGVATTPDGEGHVRVTVAADGGTGPGGVSGGAGTAEAARAAGLGRTEQTTEQRLVPGQGGAPGIERAAGTAGFTGGPGSSSGGRGAGQEGGGGGFGGADGAHGSHGPGASRGVGGSGSRGGPRDSRASHRPGGHEGPGGGGGTVDLPGQRGYGEPDDLHGSDASGGSGAHGGAGAPGTPGAPDDLGEGADALGPAGSGTRKGTPLRGTEVPRGVRKRGGFGAWARRLTGGRGQTGAEHDPYEYDTEYDEDERGALASLLPAVGARLPETWPDPAALLLTALGPGPRLWERGPGHPEALSVRLGTADRATPDGSGLLPAVPVTTGLREVGALGLAGPRPRLMGLARAVVAQLAALHSPDTLELTLISADRSRPAEERTADWSWLGWLPHLRPAHGQDCRLLLAYDREQATARLDELLRRLEDHAADTVGTAGKPGSADPAGPGADGLPGGRPARRPSWAKDDRAAGGFPGPYTVVVVDGDPGGADVREAVVRLAQDGPAAGIHVVCLAEAEAASPASPVTETYGAACAISPAFRACGAVALLSGDVATALRLLRVAPAQTAASAAPVGGVTTQAPAPARGGSVRGGAERLDPVEHARGGGGQPGSEAVPSRSRSDRPGGSGQAGRAARPEHSGRTGGAESGSTGRTHPHIDLTGAVGTVGAAGSVADERARPGGHTDLPSPDPNPPGLLNHGTVATLDAVSAAWAERFARALAPLRTDGSPGDRQTRVSAPLPQSARLLDELGLARATPASLMARWADAADDTTALGGRAWAVLGAGPRGPVSVDLVAEGPHLLIEGPVGSGRTELLRSVAASLAAAERPDRLGLALVDGRDGGGGAPGGAAGRSGEGLGVCTDLPHVGTHLMANDPVRMREFAQSLSAELKRRSELLGGLGFAEWHTRREVSGRIVPQRSARSVSRTTQGTPGTPGSPAAAGATGGGPDGAGSPGRVPTGAGTTGGGMAGGGATGGGPAGGGGLADRVSAAGGAADLDSSSSSTLRLRPGAARRAAEQEGQPGGRGTELPRLVVIVDDLDALLSPPLGSTGRPAAGSVVRALEAVAREGERLGVHLVAAGAGGRVGESELGRAAGGRIVLSAPLPGPDEPSPGRGELVTGGRTTPTPFQAGRVTGRIPRTATLRPTVVPVDWARMGDPPTRRPVRELGNGPTDLALLASALDRAAKEVSATGVPSLL